MRLAGYGLVLLALGGYEAGSPVELSLSLLGLLALAVGELRAAPVRRPRPAARPAADGAPSSAAWPTALGDGTGPDDTPSRGGRGRGRRARGEPHPDPPPRPARVDQAAAQAGHAGRAGRHARQRRPRRRPTPASSATAAGSRAAPSTASSSPRVKTGDPSFDQKFSVHGDGAARRRGAAAPGGAPAGRWRAHALARQRRALPALAPEQPRRRRCSPGPVDGSAPVAVDRRAVDMLADLVEASLPAAS